MRKLLLPALMALAAPVSSFAQSGCGGGRYLSEIFQNVDVTSDITFGANVSLNNTNTTLKLDFYEPQGDALAKRPLVVFAHGGNFIGGDKAGADAVPIAEGLAKAGMCVASINYRVGVNGIPFPGPSDADIREAVLRAVHDMKAAVRFFYKDAATTNTYGIDTNQIFVGGASAGAVTALHYAYLDNLSELPADIDTSQAGLGGGMPGLSGNPGYSDRVVGVINLSGALDDANWVNAGDEPLVSTHAVADDVVPYGTAQITFLGLFQLMVVDGSSIVHQRAQTVGVPGCLYPHYGAGVGHVPHVGSAAYLDTTLVIVRNWLSERICATSPNCAYLVGNETPQPGFGFSLLPNPSAGSTTLEISAGSATPESLELFDLQGRMLRSEAVDGRSRITLQRDGLAPGIYQVRLREASGASLTRKLVLQ